MNAMSADTDGRFYRDADRACLGGVCAGLARHFGLNLKVTRLLAVIAFFMAMPIAVIAYLAVVFLVPAASHGEKSSRAKRRESRRCRRRRRKEQAQPASGPSIAEEIDQRCKDMDERLIRLERLVTSRRFQLDQELSRL